MILYNLMCVIIAFLFFLDVDSDDKSCSDVKSPVSMVHEIALKFNLPATFSVKSEKGPPHMKVEIHFHLRVMFRFYSML